MICEHTFTVFAVISFLTSAYVVTGKSFVDTRSSILTGITQARFYICFQIEKQLCKRFYGTDNSLTNFIFNVLWVSLHRKHNRRREKGRETFGGHKRHTGIWQKLHICQKLLMMQRLSCPITISRGSLHVSGKLTNYPSLNPTFYPKWEVRVNVGLGQG